MNVTFFNTSCSSDLSEKSFGLCDGELNLPACVDVENPKSWIAKIENHQGKSLIFTAIDNCIELAEDNGKRCDGMIHFDNHLYLIELKDRKSTNDVNKKAEAQLVNTIKLLVKYNQNELNSFKVRKAFLCNRKKSNFQQIEHSEMLRFFNENYRFRLDKHAVIKIK